MEDFENQIKEKTDNELAEIFLNAHDYQPEFIKLVELELVERKIPLDLMSFLRKKKDDISDETLKIGKQGNQFLIIVAFLLSVYGGVWGFVAGYHYAYSKHKSANGTQYYYYYNESTRKYGRLMIIVGCSFFVLYIFSKIFRIILIN